MTAMPALDRRSDYVSAVAVELVDLAPDDRAELIEELDDHIAALLEDRPEVDLVTELGTPRAYAAELRAAAGLTGDARSRPGFREAAGMVSTRVVAILPWLPGFLRTLRPAWWVLRGVLAASAADLVTGFSWRSAQGTVLLVLGVAGSLWLAQRPRPGRGFRIGVRVLDVVAVLALLWVAAWSGPLAGAGDSYDSGYVQNSCASAYNLFPYDANGRPLTGVRLYDQDGQPFDVSGVSCGQPGYGPFVDSGAQPGVYPYPTTTPADQAFPTGPPTSLAPLPGATLSPSTTPGVTGTPSLSGTR